MFASTLEEVGRSDPALGGWDDRPGAREPGSAAERVVVGTFGGMDRPPADPKKMLDVWMQWERGDTTPGQVLKELKIAGLRELLEAQNGVTS